MIAMRADLLTSIKENVVAVSPRSKLRVISPHSSIGRRTSARIACDFLAGRARLAISRFFYKLHVGVPQALSSLTYSTWISIKNNAVMKRQRSLKPQNGMRAYLPQELWVLIAHHLVEDTTSAFQFMLVSWSARRALEEALMEWYEKTREAFQEAMNQADDQTAHILPGTLYNRSWSHCINYFEAHGFPALPFEKSLKNVDIGHVTALFYIFHISLLEKSWGCRPEDEFSEGNLIHRKIYKTGLRLRDAFYLDNEQQCYKPLKLLPGLRVVPMDPTRGGLVKQVNDYISQQREDPYVKRLKSRGLEATKSSQEYRVTAHALMKSSLKHQKPHGSDPLCNAIWNGRHLFDECKQHDALKIRIYRVKSHSKQKKLKVLEFRRSVSSRPIGIWNRLRGICVDSFRKIPFVHDVLDENVILY